MVQASAFLQCWWDPRVREALLSHLPSRDLKSLRLACHDFSIRAAPVLFEELSVSFCASTFTRPSRMAALERIGSHIRTLNFRMDHTPSTFLPPLLDPVTGEEQIFIYEPQLAQPKSRGRSRQPKYGSWEMTDLLTKQYGPIFHAATNVPAFIRAISAMPYLKHVKISCAGQDPTQRHRRSTVDYALISLRIAIERAPLEQLTTLSLLPIHPAGILYLRSTQGFGATPSSPKRWKQIKKLAIHMDGWNFSASRGNDHLKILHDYLRSLSPNVERLFFRWKGGKGPSPFTLDSEPCLLPPSLVLTPPTTPTSITRSAATLAAPWSSSATLITRRPLHSPRKKRSIPSPPFIPPSALTPPQSPKRKRSFPFFGALISSSSSSPPSLLTPPPSPRRKGSFPTASISTAAEAAVAATSTILPPPVRSRPMPLPSPPPSPVGNKRLPPLMTSMVSDLSAFEISPKSISPIGLFTSPKCLSPPRSPLAKIRFPRLQHMYLQNTLTSSPQIATFIRRHRHSLREFDFEDVELAPGGTWESALRPLTKISGNERWKEGMSSGEDQETEGEKSSLSEKGEASDKVGDGRIGSLAQMRAFLRRSSILGITNPLGPTPSGGWI
ncbi:MAG: hypothetical protein M1829_006322 [Trizodia sp. TS-e1964]|nr:MAG: hypothetical protein M1829_006322 [Trizodia sp. TS-e1964]